MKDKFNKDISFLKDKKLFLFDMDGTIYLDNALFEYTIPLLNILKKQNKKFVFITNNSSKSVDQYLEKLTSLKIECDKSNIYTSTLASILYIKTYYPNALVYAMGTKAFILELKNNGLRVTTRFRKDIDIVLTGFDSELSMKKLSTTIEVLTNIKDVIFLATNPDLYCPSKKGNIVDNGSICTCIKNACGRYPSVFLGKPKKEIIEMVCKYNNISLSDTVIFGDRLFTDVEAGINAKIDSFLVLSGESTLEQSKKYLDKHIYVIESIKDIYDTLNN